MEMIIVLVLLALFLFAGAVLSFLNREKIALLTKLNKNLSNRVELLNNQVNKLQSRLEALQLKTPDLQSDIAPVDNATTQDISPESILSPDSESTTPPPVLAAKIKASPPVEATSVQVSNEAATEKLSSAVELWLKNNMLLWMGGLVLALGGIFLAKFAIDTGMLSPVVRVIAGALFGMSLIAGAEYLHRNAQRFSIHSAHVVAAIASGGSITCFAMVMVAWEVYQFISMPIAFILMAAISVLAIILALRYGPIMAVIGIIGAYLVPLLVSSGSGNLTILLIYVCCISGAALWVSQKVQRSWLWWQSFAGHFLWFLVATLTAQSGDVVLLLMMALASLYLFVLSEMMGWHLRQKMQTALAVKTLLMPRKEQLPMLLSVIFMAFVLFQHSSDSTLILANVILGATLVISALRYSAFDSWPFVALLFALFSLSLFSAPGDYSDNLFPFSGGYLFTQLLAFTSVLYSAWLIKRFPDRLAYLLLLVAAPISLYSLSYILAPNEASAYLHPLWIIELLVLSAAGCFMATKAADKLHKICWLTLSNGCLSLCLTIALSESLLTLALLVQMTAMCYLTRKYLVTLPDWIYKFAIIIATARLTFGPWLGSHADETLFGLHWTLPIYPLATLALYLAQHFSTSSTLKIWLNGAILQVVALFVTTETSWWLTGRYPSLSALTFNESVMLSLNWMILGSVYLWRHQLSQSKHLYKEAGNALLTVALIIQLKNSLLDSPYFAEILIGEGPINWLIPLWALPALLLMLLCHKQLLSGALQQPAKAIAGVFAFLFINGMIRNQFQQGNINLVAETSQSELYAYSIVWLFLATTCIFLAQHKASENLKKLGFGLLAMVVLKAFLVDMANLEGLFRALSFIGLGLSLVGIGWLFQKIQKPANKSITATQ